MGTARKREETESSDAITADHKVLSEENEFRLQHRSAVVVWWKYMKLRVLDFVKKTRKKSMK